MKWHVGVVVVLLLWICLVDVSFGFYCTQFEQGAISPWKPSSRLKKAQQALYSRYPKPERSLFRLVFKQLDRTCIENSSKTLSFPETNTLFIESVYNKLKKRINTPYLKQFFLGPPIATIKGTPYKGNPATWMNDLKGFIGDYPLNRLVIPGTRASFSNHIHEFSIISPDGKNHEQFIFKTLKYYPKDVLNRVQAAWSKIQSRSVLLQLRDGVRYFDIRVCRDKSTFKKITMLKSCHTMFDRPIEESLNEIAQFMKESPNELIILDFSHFFEMSSFDHSYLIGVLKQKFGNLLANSLTIKPTSSLNEIWKQTKQRVIVIYNEDNIVRKSKGLFWSPSSSIQYLRPIVRNNHDLFMRLSKEMTLRKSEDQTFFAIQSNLTPDNIMIANGIIGRPSSSLELAHFYNPEVVNWFSKNSLPRKQVNIIMFDNYSDNKEIMSVFLQQNTITI